MVLAFLCVGLGTFLTFAATVLCILANMGQITGNIVSRHIRFVSVDTTGFGAALRANTTGAPVGNLYAPDQAFPEAEMAGLKYNYQWGLYNYCGGGGTSDPRSCVDNEFGRRWQPLDVILADLPSDYQSATNNFIDASTFRDNSYLGRFSNAAFYLIFIGTILAGLAWLTGFLAHRFAFALAALIAFGASGCLVVGAVIWTVIIAKTRNSISADLGITVDYGNALWFIWASFAACIASVVPYILSCCTGRSKY